MAELQRASVFGIKQQSSLGSLALLDNAVQFIELKSGFAQVPGRETIEAETIINDIGPTKPKGGLETPTGTHGLNVKHSGVEGQSPEWALLLHSALGDSFTKAGETTLAGGSTAGDSTAAAVLKVADSSIYRVGMAVLIKDLTNGYSIRNISEIVDPTTLKLNYNLSAAPASGVATGIPVMIFPAVSGHPAFSAWLFNANGAAISAIQDCRTSDFGVTIPAADKMTADVSYAGTKFYWNPLTVTAANKFLDFSDSVPATYSVSIEEKTYQKPQDLAAALQNAMNASASVDNYTVEYISLGADAGKFKISSDNTPFSILWSTGSHGSGGTDDHIGTLLGFSDAADDTGAGNYTSDNPIDLTYSSTGLTPSYDDTDFVVAKKGEVMIGDFDENVCRDSEEVTFSIATPQEDVRSICADSGLLERLILSRTVTMTATIITPKYESGLFARFLDDTTTQAMINVGPKDVAGNWVAGKGINFYMAQSTVTQHEIAAGDVLKTTVAMSGFVSTLLKDLYVNFV